MGAGAVALPPVGDGNDAGAVLGNVLEDGLGEVEVFLRGVAPAAGVVGEGGVGGTEVGGGDDNGARKAPPPVVDAADLIAGTAAQPVVEQRRAQRRRLRPVPLAVQISIPASSPCNGQNERSRGAQRRR
ncbi:unnamed protein product [Spirodela intermedia]|uniref:Uncharacterized protein n=1 Tax=Spirodela intermedia TaxID=51605 RepID=A0A7I8KCT4_SPIIN|nr:unnamed protein product [Spirodela intermedia]